MRSAIALTVGTSLLAAQVATAQLPPAGQLNFVTCPIIRDTEPTPCWLAEYRGELYYLGLQQDTEADFFPPQQLHKALIEGKVDPNAKRICGGIVLSNVRATTLPEIDASCQQMLPAEGYVAPPARRGAIPRDIGDQLATNPVDTHKPRPAWPTPVPPFKPKSYLLPFEFDGEFMLNKATRPLVDAWVYANQIHASRIDILGQRGRVLLSDGGVLEEKPAIARQRAETVAEALRDLDPGDTKVVVRWVDAPLPANGRTDYDARTVLVTVQP